MKTVRYVFVMMTLVVITACSKGSDEAQQEKLVNHANMGDMGKQLEGNPMQGYGTALDKAHDVGDTLQKSADQMKIQGDTQDPQ